MKRFISIFAVAFAALVAGAYIVPAQPAAAAGSAALSIVPKKNYFIEPGKSVKDTLVIRNLDGQEPLNLTLRVVDFTYTDDGGTPKLMLAEDAPQTTWSLKPYITLPKTITIAPKESTTVDMSVAMPAGHGAGSYYSAIVYSSDGSKGGNVGLTASGVTLVFASVPGKVNEDLKLQDFGAYLPANGDKKARYTYFAFQKPNTIAYTLKNSGNVTESPVGSITMTSMFGQKTNIDNINPNSSLALIGQTRTFTSCIKIKDEKVDFNGAQTKSVSCDSPNLWPGFYKLKLDAFYGQNGNNTKEIVKEASFWYLPLWSIIVFVVLVAVIAFVIWRLVRKVRTALNGSSKKSRR